VEIRAMMGKIGLVLAAAKAMSKFATNLVSSRMTRDDHEEDLCVAEQVDEDSSPEEMAAAALRTYKRLARQAWQKEVEHELRVYYTHSTTEQLTLAQFSQLLQRWNSEMGWSEEHQLLLAMMDLKAPWLISDEQLQLWLCATLHLLDEEVSVEVLDELMPLDGVRFLAARPDTTKKPSNRTPLVRRAWMGHLFKCYASNIHDTRFVKQPDFEQLTLVAGCKQIKGPLRKAYDLQDLYDWSDSEFAGWQESQQSDALLPAMQTTPDATQLVVAAREARSKLGSLAAQRRLTVNRNMTDGAGGLDQKLFHRFFKRYDLDMSGMIEDAEHFKCLTLSLLTTLHVSLPVSIVDQRMQGPILTMLTGNHAWSTDEYQEWFVATFLSRANTLSDPPAYTLNAVDDNLGRSGASGTQCNSTQPFALDETEKTRSNASGATYDENSATYDEKDAAGSNARPVCLVCFNLVSEVETCIFVPCGHQCACLSCAQVLEKCPICNNAATAVKVFHSYYEES